MRLLIDFMKINMDVLHCMIIHIYRRMFVRNSHLKISVCCLLHVGLFLGLFSESEDGGDMFLRKVCWLFTGLHGVISQKAVFFIAHLWEPQIRQFVCFKNYKYCDACYVSMWKLVGKGVYHSLICARKIDYEDGRLFDVCMPLHPDNHWKDIVWRLLGS
jgi:hypothetical protein